MKRIFTALLVISALVSSYGLRAQSSKQGKIITVKSSAEAEVSDDVLSSKTFKLSSISGIEAGSVFNIEVVKGRSGKITVSAPKETLEHIIVSHKGSVLKLRIENGYNINNGSSIWFSRKKNLKGPIKIVAEIPSLSYIDLSGASKLYTKDSFSEDECIIKMSGASKVFITKLNADKLNIDLSGASNIKMSGTYKSTDIEMSGASIVTLNGNSTKIEADISGASKLTVNGKADILELDSSGASEFNGTNFQAKEMSLDMGGASKAELTVTKRISGEISGASKFTYYGNPDKVFLEKSRGASVLRK